MSDPALKFYPGYHQPSQVKNLGRAFVSIHRLQNRKSDVEINEWILDSGAFTQVSKVAQLSIEEAAATDGYLMSVEEYAEQIARWSRCGNLVAACSQDFMCEDEIFAPYCTDPETGEELSWEDQWMLGETRGISIEEHQQQTVDRFVKLKRALLQLGCDTYLMPILQGYSVEDYLHCLDLYETSREVSLLPHGAYVGVGSVCKRNSNPESVVGILKAIKERRPDLKLHGFGLKVTALKDPEVVALLHSCDSMAWSTHARKNGGDRNCWTTAQAYAEKVEAIVAAHDDSQDNETETTNTNTTMNKTNKTIDITTFLKPDVRQRPRIRNVAIGKLDNGEQWNYTVDPDLPGTGAIKTSYEFSYTLTCERWNAIEALRSTPHFEQLRAVEMQAARFNPWGYEEEAFKALWDNFRPTRKRTFGYGGGFWEKDLVPTPRGTAYKVMHRGGIIFDPEDRVSVFTSPGYDKLSAKDLEWARQKGLLCHRWSVHCYCG